MSQNTRAKWQLVRQSEGIVGVEIVTSRRLGSVVGNRGVVYEPAEYLAWRRAFVIDSLAPIGQPRRYLEFRSSVPGLGRAHIFQDLLDLSAGSANRELVEAMSEQEQIPVVWVNEGVAIEYPVEPRHAGYWREVLETTKDLPASVYREEIAEVLWTFSPSFRPGLPRPRRSEPRAAEPPALPIPYFAARSGRLPTKGRVKLAGLVLPAGSRRPVRGPAYWATDEPVEALQDLAPALAERFADTGLWPVLWRYPEDPEGYMGGHGNFDEIDEIDARQYLAERNGAAFAGDSTAHEPPALPATKEASQQTHEAPSAVKPFPDWALQAPAHLLLVPCNRPADAITALGGVSGDTRGPVISAVLRSWEERFGAFVYEVAPGLVRLHLTRPVQRADLALSVSAELHAADPSFAPRIGDLSKTARILLGEDRVQPADADIPRLTATDWDVAW